MHIETELDATHAKRLLELQRRTNKPLEEVLADAIDAAWLQQNKAEDEGSKSRLYQAFEEAGLIGCIDTGKQLSANYKTELDFSVKHGSKE